MQNCSKCYPTLDEFITALSDMCPIVDSKDNVVFLKQVKFLIFLILFVFRSKIIYFLAT